MGIAAGSSSRPTTAGATRAARRAVDFEGWAGDALADLQREGSRWLSRIGERLSAVLLSVAQAEFRTRDAGRRVALRDVDEATRALARVVDDLLAQFDEEEPEEREAFARLAVENLDAPSLAVDPTWRGLIEASARLSDAVAAVRDGSADLPDRAAAALRSARRAEAAWRDAFPDGLAGLLVEARARSAFAHDSPEDWGLGPHAKG